MPVMKAANYSHQSLFSEGYDKGRQDGIAQALAVVGLVVEAFPDHVVSAARQLLPEGHGALLAERIHDFGLRCYRKGKAEEKKKGEAQ